MSRVCRTGIFPSVGEPAATFARRLGPAVLAGVALGGCVCGHLRSKDQLSLDAVEPAVAVAGVRTPLLLRGNGFRPGMVTDVDGKTATAESLSLRIGPAEIAGPVLRADGAIEAMLPDTLAPGIYEVSLSLGQRQAAGAALQIVAPIEVALEAPGDLASGEERPFSVEVTSRAPSGVMLALEGLGGSPDGSATASGLVLPVLVGPQEPVKVFGKLISERPAAIADAALAVSVHWSLGPLSGTEDAAPSLRPPGVPRLAASINRPPEMQSGARRPRSTRLWAPPDVDLAHVNLEVTAGGGAALASNLSVSGAAIAAGGALSLPGSIQGVSVGPG